ncbi:MAG: alpha-L-rhamnosidase N-terminal domain-containing protein, partial [Prevotella sp.]|nr:alpha-L-rhamnosidase N-terminal domain-containing protein [Prevotella sp.]
THPPFWPLKPPVWFEKRFRLKDTIRFARLYATAHGVYHPYINRMRPDDREFAPEHTVYEKIQYYQTYDVTKLLIPGENRISFHVGDGWYLCPQTRQQISGFTGRPAVLFQLEVTYSDGERETIFSDGSESCRTGQITWSDIFLGEKQNDTLSDGNLYPVTLGHFSMNQLFNSLIF